MKTKKLGYLLFVMSMLVATNSAFAHSLTGKTLRSSFGASATDVWQVQCSSEPALNPPETHHLVAQILDRSGDTNFLPLVIVKGTNAVTTVDSTGGDAVLSPKVSLNGGNGNYLMIVNYTRPLSQVYNIEYHCENSNNDHTTTTAPSSAIQDN